MYKEIKKCRICGNDDLIPVLSLGKQCLTGVFPRTKSEKIESGPLELVKCNELRDSKSCGLLQLRHSYNFNQLYGDNYGYRSGLNNSMVEHLKNKVKKVIKYVKLSPGDVVVDIGSNDGTLLKAYPENGIVLVGCDPTADKFREHYPDDATIICDFFSSSLIKKNIGAKRARIVSSIAMFYDLESPVEFMEQIYEILSDDGVWIFEQSYMPLMLEMNSYDTVCHEHIEYYRLKQIKMMADRAGFKIIDIETNSANGGSFSIIVAKKGSVYREAQGAINDMLKGEELSGLDTMMPYEDFRKRVFEHKETLPEYIKKLKEPGKRILGYGASTKGNVLLQFCNLTENDISCIAEVNTYKFGRYTPGTLIPIISEEDAKSMKPDYFMVLPWHFRDSIIKRERSFLKAGCGLLFPLPRPEVVKA